MRRDDRDASSSIDHRLDRQPSDSDRRSRKHDHDVENGTPHHNGHPPPVQRQPHRAVGFWNPAMAKVRAHVLVLWARTVLILLVFILLVLSLYWGVLYRVNANLRSIVVHVVDFDGQVAPFNTSSSSAPLVGPQVVELSHRLLHGAEPSLGYQTLPPSAFGYDPLAVRQAVYDWKSWAAVVVSANATALLLDAVRTGNASYDPTGAVTIVIQSARDSTAVSSHIMPQLENFIAEFTVTFGAAWARTLAVNLSSLEAANLQAAAAAVNPGVAPTLLDLRPFSPAAATPSVSIGLIYLIIMAFFSFSFFLPIHMKYIQPIGHPPLHFYQLILWRWLATMAAYLLISLAYSMISLAFQIPFWPPPSSPVWPPPSYGATAYGLGSFPVYWMLHFAGMAALGLACENVAMLVGQPWTALWLIFWVISNVSTSFYALDLAPGFYGWGYAWPLRHVVEASRQILFDLHSRIGLNFGVLFAWIAIDTALFPFCCYFMRWKGERDERMAEKHKDRYVVEMEDGSEEEVEKREGEEPPIRKRGFLRGA